MIDISLIKKDLTEIGKQIIKENNLSDIEIQFKHVRRGRARRKTRKITIPIWAITGVKAYGIYYVIHEIVHFIKYDLYNLGDYHGELFKKIETSILKKYNIKSIYNKAYAKYLTDLNGNKICKKYGEAIDFYEKV